MDIIVFESHQLPIALGALRALVTPSARHDHYLEVIARLHGRTLRASALPLPAAAQVADVIDDAHRRTRLVQLGAIMVMVDGLVTGPSLRALSELASALSVDEPALRVLPSIVARDLFATRARVLPRVLRIMFGSAWRGFGVRGLGQIVGGLLKIGRDPATAARYAMLADYPIGSVGRALSEYLTRNEFGLPGLPGSIPESGLFHDVGHLLSGYDTNPAGEIQQAAFQAGFVREDGFAFLFFGIVQFHVGIKITPVAEAEVGYFDIDKVMTALARGASCRVDLSDRMDFWKMAGQQLDQLRADLHIPAVPAAHESRAA